MFPFKEKIGENRDSAYFYSFRGLPWGNACSRRLKRLSSFLINDSSPQGRPVIEHFLISLTIVLSSFSCRYLRQLTVSSTK